MSLSEHPERCPAGDCVVLTVVGCLDTEGASILRTALINLLYDGQRHLVLHLEGVDLLDSAGLGVLVGALRRARQSGGSLRLVCTQQQVLKVFGVTGLDTVLPIHPSVEEAVAAG